MDAGKTQGCVAVPALGEAVPRLTTGAGRRATAGALLGVCQVGAGRVLLEMLNISLT